MSAFVLPSCEHHYQYLLKPLNKNSHCFAYIISESVCSFISVFLLRRDHCWFLRRPLSRGVCEHKAERECIHLQKPAHVNDEVISSSSKKKKKKGCRKALTESEQGWVEKSSGILLQLTSGCTAAGDKIQKHYHSLSISGWQTDRHFISLSSEKQEQTKLFHIAPTKTLKTP